MPAIRCLRAAALALGKALGGGGGSASVTPLREALNRAATCAYDAFLRRQKSTTPWFGFGFGFGLGLGLGFGF